MLYQPGHDVNTKVSNLSGSERRKDSGAAEDSTLSSVWHLVSHDLTKISHQSDCSAPISSHRGHRRLRC